MKLNIGPEILELARNLGAQIPRMRELKAEAKEHLRKERQCTGTTAKGTRCEAWAVWGDPNKRCSRHGGAETAKLPRCERLPACTCAAYSFPHRQRSGLCNYPDKPSGEHTAKGRRYEKRARKKRTKQWLKELGV